ncbi:uncharacterized protein METZ01_LOCUS384184, partial [marine metagenome]
MQILAEVGCDLGYCSARRNRVLGMDVAVPQPWQQVRTFQVYKTVIGRAGWRAAVP